jgi:hypothetical protein
VIVADVVIMKAIMTMMMRTIINELWKQNWQRNWRYDIGGIVGNRSLHHGNTSNIILRIKISDDGRN